MAPENATVRVLMDIPTLRRFALYDAFIYKKGWRAPTIFGVIMLAFGIVAVFSGKSQAYLLGGLLMLIALGMPAAYFFTFRQQVKAQGKKLGLDKPRPAYTVMLAPDGIEIENNMKQEEKVHLDWNALHGACRVNGAIYIYATVQKAFVLPDGQADISAQELWELVSRHIDKEKLVCGRNTV